MGSRCKLGLLLLLECLSSSAAAAASDSLSVGESLTGNRTLVSEGGKFELGFFSPAGDSSYYVGIWYKQIPVQTVIWVMNRDRPVSDPSSSELTLAPDGNLVLLLNQNQIWSSTIHARTSNGPVVAALLDSGNLVLRGRQPGNSSEVMWQSFEHPTDTLMPGGWVGLNKSSGAYQTLVSWRSAVDPSTGLYMDWVDPSGSGQYTFSWNGTTVYHRVGASSGQRFASVPEMGMSARYKYNSVNNDEEVSFSFEVVNPSTLSRMVMSPHGQLTMFDWSSESRQWLLHWATPTSPCDVYSVCGPFGLCDVAGSQYCRCLPAFDAASPGDWSGGCARKTSLHCSNGTSTDGFLPVENVKLPSSYFSAAGSSGDCASACLRNCSCTAYAYSGGCMVWGGDLRNIQQVTHGEAGSSTLFLRVAAADLTATGNHGGASTNERDVILVASSVSFLTILCLFVFVCWRRRGANTVRHDGSLLVFSHGYLARCTDNFSQKLGMGSFGSVYKGTLRDGVHTAVAVKRLEGSAQGEKQFRAEVRTLGTIHHVNLVRLRGFCATRRERLLVYDYMPNGSLASAMAGPSFGLLDWGTRFGIMAGVARGLAYLHEQCQERIVHCDVKPENILLDTAFRPKVADFGMAKLIGRDFSHALTTARGTVSEGQFVALLDERLAGDADVGELGRACSVACWCIQQSEAMRPTMGQVVQVLEGSLTVGAAPVPRHLEVFCAEDSRTAYPLT
uniref:Receptor-like serine/threonine-protein kinase n=1 Tax=Aegilops tauschii subsp. strangulata TaxID=200361 RepID=A0A453IFX4_AEGTS